MFPIYKTCIIAKLPIDDWCGFCRYPPKNTSYSYHIGGACAIIEISQTIGVEVKIIGAGKFLSRILKVNIHSEYYDRALKHNFPAVYDEYQKLILLK